MDEYNEKNPLEPLVLMAVMHPKSAGCIVHKVMDHTQTLSDVKHERIFYGRGSVASYLGYPNTKAISLAIANRTIIRGYMIFPAVGLITSGNTVSTTVPEVVEVFDRWGQDRYWIIDKSGNRITDINTLLSEAEVPGYTVGDGQSAAIQSRIGFLSMRLFQIFGINGLKLIDGNASDFQASLSAAIYKHLEEAGNLVDFKYDIAGQYDVITRQSADMEIHSMAPTPVTSLSDIVVTGDKFTLPIDTFVELVKYRAKQVQNHLPFIINRQFLLGNLMDLAGTTLYGQDEYDKYDVNALTVRELRMLAMFVPFGIQNIVHRDICDLIDRFNGDDDFLTKIEERLTNIG